MNVITLFAAAVLAHNIFGGSGSSGNLSASIEYTSVDRSGNLMTVRLSSGDPYYGRDYFYYGDRHYYQYAPAYLVVEPPRPWYWHPKKWKRHPHECRWVQVVRYDERRLPVTKYVLVQPEREIVRFEDVRRAPERYLYASYSSGKGDQISGYRFIDAESGRAKPEIDYRSSAKTKSGQTDFSKSRAKKSNSPKSNSAKKSSSRPDGGPKVENRGKVDQWKRSPNRDVQSSPRKSEKRRSAPMADKTKGKSDGRVRLASRPDNKQSAGRVKESGPKRTGSKPDKGGRESRGGSPEKGSRGKGRG